MVTKNDFIRKYIKHNGVECITKGDVSNALDDAYRTYTGDINTLRITVLNRYGIEFDSNVKEHVKKILMDEHGFDTCDILDIYKIDSKTIGVSFHLYWNKKEIQ